MVTGRIGSVLEWGATFAVALALFSFGSDVLGTIRDPTPAINWIRQTGFVLVSAIVAMVIVELLAVPALTNIIRTTANRTRKKKGLSPLPASDQADTAAGAGA